MRNQDIIAGALAILGVGAIAALMFAGDEAPVSGISTPAPVTFEDGPGPNLEIAVVGQADGMVVIDLLPEAAPAHVARLTELAETGAYDGVVFHRVIDGFMAQTGDVAYGRAGGDLSRAGQGGSDLPDLPAEFTEIPFDRGVVGMARAASPDSANSQFFIMFDEGYFLNGDYTVVGRVVGGMDVVDAIARGEPPTEPDRMARVTVVP